MGLSLPLDGFSFAFTHHSAASTGINPELQDHADRWSCWQYRPTADYLMAICAERHVDDAPAISMGKFTPLGNEMPVIAPFLRRSATCSLILIPASVYASRGKRMNALHERAEDGRVGIDNAAYRSTRYPLHGAKTDSTIVGDHRPEMHLHIKERWHAFSVTQDSGRGSMHACLSRTF